MPLRDGVKTQPRTPLNRGRILQVAVAMADAEGLKSLTMRKIGQTLDVEAMSLYNHIRDKDDILCGIVDRVLSDIDLSPTSHEWKVAMRQSAISAHDVLLRHPWTCELILSPKSIQIVPARMQYIESILARFREAGFSPAGASRGYHAIDSHILGFTLWELGHSIPKGAPPDFLETFSRQFDFDSYPYLGEHLNEHTKEAEANAISEFEFGLDLILDGLEKIMERASTRAVHQ